MNPKQNKKKTDGIDEKTKQKNDFLEDKTPLKKSSLKKDAILAKSNKEKVDEKKPSLLGKIISKVKKVTKNTSKNIKKENVAKIAKLGSFFKKKPKTDSKISSEIKPEAESKKDLEIKPEMNEQLDIKISNESAEEVGENIKIDAVDKTVETEKKEEILDTKDKDVKKEEKKDKTSIFDMFKKKKEDSDSPKKDKEDEAGNAFTHVFDKKGSEDFIGTIIKTAKGEEEKEEKKGIKKEEKKTFNKITEKFTEEKKSKKVEKSEKKAMKLSHVAKIAAIASFIVPLTSLAFYSINLDPDNKVVKMFSLQTVGKVLQEKEEIKKIEEAELKEITENIDELQVKIKELENNTVMGDILSKRTDWLYIINEINRITDKRFSNRYTNTVVFTSYSGKNDGSQISLQGEVRDVGGKSMTQLTELIRLINGHEKFDGAEMRSFSKRLDNDGNAVSSFSLTFQYYPDGKFKKVI